MSSCLGWTFSKGEKHNPSGSSSTWCWLTQQMPDSIGSWRRRFSTCRSWRCISVGAPSPPSITLVFLRRLGLSQQSPNLQVSQNHRALGASHTANAIWATAGWGNNNATMVPVLQMQQGTKTLTDSESSTDLCESEIVHHLFVPVVLNLNTGMAQPCTTFCLLIYSKHI